MKKQICIIVLLLTCRICVAQNLVVNPSFEDTLTCSSFQGGNPYQELLCAPWFQPTYGSPDYYSSVSTCYAAGPIPNTGSNQTPRTGFAVCAFGLYDMGTLTNYREYIEGLLIDTLIANHNYCVSFYVSLTSFCKLAIDRFGAFLSVDSLLGGNNQPLTVAPQIENPTGLIISDTANWVLISGNYLAQGGEKFITIGNFYNDANTDTAHLPWGIYNETYYYIDDVSIVDCTVGVEEINKNVNTVIYPNPISDKLNIAINNKERSEVFLYDIASRKLLQQKFTNSVSLNTEQLAKGLYLYEVRDRNGLCKKGKVVKD